MTKNIENIFNQTNYKSKIDKQKKNEIRHFLMIEAEKMNKKSKKICVFKFIWATGLAFVFSLFLLNINLIIWDFWWNKTDITNKVNIEKIAYKKYLWNNKSISILNSDKIESEKLLYKVRKSKQNFQKLNTMAFNYQK